jgi:hypothetical protein
LLAVYSFLRSGSSLLGLAFLASRFLVVVGASSFSCRREGLAVERVLPSSQPLKSFFASSPTQNPRRAEKSGPQLAFFACIFLFAWLRLAGFLALDAKHTLHRSFAFCFAYAPTPPCFAFSGFVSGLGFLAVERVLPSSAKRKPGLLVCALVFLLCASFFVLCASIFFFSCKIRSF